MTRSGPSTSAALDPTRFSVVDDTADPNFYVRFMEHVLRTPDIVTGRMLSTAMLQLRAGHRVLDVGCGPALDAADLAARIGARGELVGVDASAAMIAARAGAATSSIRQRASKSVPPTSCPSRTLPSMPPEPNECSCTSINPSGPCMKCAG